MAYPDNLLSRGEQVVLHKHPHWKVLVLPVLFFVVIIGGAFALAAVLRNWQYHSLAWIGIAVVAVLLLVFLVLVPFLRWRTEHFVITNHHVFFRTGILHRREHQIPLGHIQNMETSVSFWGRLLGFGSLIVESAADQPLEFENVASLPRVQSTLNQLIMDDRGRFSGGDGYGPGPDQRWAGDEGDPRRGRRPPEHKQPPRSY
ncbi:PH domain-containing protein [Nakamurella endophytica]|uniref:YdbS-like PH domain-containing protein n=1 Tax=Nakamurella endophytica TaxID=1748367 RepID=A0A917WF77_9ACTN|nr:PH domain-containing protein [Nakamurella endophytica]GGM01836.1 hypothetical protein GCM10011594_22370 [Nakamurella endophytica]